MAKEIDPFMTFKSFIEGDSNRLAKAASYAIAENPGCYNPLYIYGPRGTGKTHLLKAIAAELTGRGLKVLFGRAENLNENLCKRDKEYKVIIADDAASLKDTEGPELIAFIEGGHQLVLSGTLPPDKLPDSELSKLIREKGKSADIQPPEEELRIAIVRAKAEEENINISDEAIFFLAEHIRENIASLIGGLHRVSTLARLSSRPIDKFAAIEALKDYIWHEE